MAEVDLDGASEQLMQVDFDQQVKLGQDRVPKGEGLGAPPPGEEELLEDAALAAFDPDSSGFDQAFTPRVVSALETAYTSALSVSRPPAPVELDRRHLLSLGYGMYSPPAQPVGGGHGVSLAYAYRFGVPVQLGGRVVFGFSDHQSASTGSAYDMQRLMVQAEAAYLLPFAGRFEAAFGGYLGWQLVMVTEEVLMREGEKERTGTVLTGDPLGFRAGLAVELRVTITGGLWASITGAGGVELVHQQDQQGNSRLESFWRPQVFGQVGYAF
jgi:hypothetical protein